MPILLLYALPVVLLLFLFRGGSKKAKLDDFFTGGSEQINKESGNTYQTPTITQTKAKSLAEALHLEMGGFVSSEKKLIDMLRPLNESDYIMVFDAFGIRGYDTIFNSGGGLLWSDDFD